MQTLFKPSVIVSLIWLAIILIGSILIGSKDGFAIFIALGILPLCVLWGLDWMLSRVNPKIQKKIFLSIGIMIGVFSISFLAFYIYQQYFSEKAILNARWGMSPLQVENANNITLSNNNNIFLLELNLALEPNILDKSRFQFMKSNDVRLFGEETRIDYDFFDNKLYRYVVWISLWDKQKVENEILPMLKSEYGDGNSNKPTLENEIQSYEWNTSSKEVSSSLYEKKDGYTAIIRVKYLPIYHEIESISAKEKSSYF